jgi:hypothetical protein
VDGKDGDQGDKYCKIIHQHTYRGLYIFSVSSENRMGHSDLNTLKEGRNQTTNIFFSAQVMNFVIGCFLAFVLQLLLYENVIYSHLLLILLVLFHTELFHIERGFYSRTEIGEREIEVKAAYIMNAVGYRTCLAVCPAPLPPPLI